MVSINEGALIQVFSLWIHYYNVFTTLYLKIQNIVNIIIYSDVIHSSKIIFQLLSSCRECNNLNQSMIWIEIITTI